MENAPDLPIIALSYEPLHQKNERWGDQCHPHKIYTDLEFIRFYRQNVNNISKSTGLKYDQTFGQMKNIKASIFAFNKTHTSDPNNRNTSVFTQS